MTHSRREIYLPHVLLNDIQGDVQMETLLQILAQHHLVLGIRANGSLRVRRLGQRTLHPDLAQLVARHEDTLRAVVLAHRAKGQRA